MTVERSIKLIVIQNIVLVSIKNDFDCFCFCCCCCCCTIISYNKNNNTGIAKKANVNLVKIPIEQIIPTCKANDNNVDGDDDDDGFEYVLIFVTVSLALILDVIIVLKSNASTIVSIEFENGRDNIHTVGQALASSKTGIGTPPPLVLPLSLSQESFHTEESTMNIDNIEHAIRGMINISVPDNEPNDGNDNTKEYNRIGRYVIIVGGTIDRNAFFG
jgi:hypothetical protein